MIYNQPRSRLNIERVDSIRAGRRNLRGFLLTRIKITKVCTIRSMDQNTLPSFSKGQTSSTSMVQVSHGLYLRSRVRGGITSALRERVCFFAGCNQCSEVSLLARKRGGSTPHETFGSFLELAKSIGCPYLLD